MRAPGFCTPTITLPGPIPPVPGRLPLSLTLVPMATPCTDTEKQHYFHDRSNVRTLNRALLSYNMVRTVERRREAACMSNMAELVQSVISALSTPIRALCWGRLWEPCGQVMRVGTWGAAQSAGQGWWRLRGGGVEVRGDSEGRHKEKIAYGAYQTSMISLGVVLCTPALGAACRPMGRPCRRRLNTLTHCWEGIQDLRLAPPCPRDHKGITQALTLRMASQHTQLDRLTLSLPHSPPHPPPRRPPAHQPVAVPRPCPPARREGGEDRSAS
jgi:hypothetical protein